MIIMLAYGPNNYLFLKQENNVMAPNVTVPMNFGKHLLSSPTHNTLKLNTSKGGVVCASSVILSFNSPVIDHMTTTLHMTSVDMLEFSETAVKVFVDAAYSGTVEGLNKELFRDVNKMGNVFEVSWLAGECAQYFSEITDSVETVSYPEFVYLFEEAAFVFEHLGTKDFLKLAIKRITELGWKQQFIDKYLKNADILSTKKLEMVIELAGEQVSCVVKTLCSQLSDQLNNQRTFVLPDYCKYLLDNSDLHSCKQSDPVLFEQLFDVLEKLPESVSNLKWMHQLYRGSINSSKRKIDYTDEANSSETVSESNDIANLYLDFDYNMSYDELLDWITTSETVQNIFMAIEAVWAWTFYQGYNIDDPFDLDFSELSLYLAFIQENRGWKLLPHSFVNVRVELSLLDTETEDFNFDCSRFCHSPEAITPSSVFIDCIETCASNPLSLLSKDARLIFHFKPPSLSHCDLPGECGFILKTVPRLAGLLNKLTLCVEKEDYLHESVHFHEELRAENMHVFFERRYNEKSYLHSLSWLGSLIDSKLYKYEQRHYFDWFAIMDNFIFQSNSRFKVFYRFD